MTGLDMVLLSYGLFSILMSFITNSNHWKIVILYKFIPFIGGIFCCIPSIPHILRLLQ